MVKCILFVDSFRMIFFMGCDDLGKDNVKCNFED